LSCSIVDSSAWFCLELVLVLVRFDEVLDAHVKFGRGKRFRQKVARAGFERGKLGSSSARAVSR
jgi:hypothetical protein